MSICFCFLLNFFQGCTTAYGSTNAPLAAVDDQWEDVATHNIEVTITLGPNQEFLTDDGVALASGLANPNDETLNALLNLRNGEEFFLKFDGNQKKWYTTDEELVDAAGHTGKDKKIYQKKIFFYIMTKS